MTRVAMGAGAFIFFGLACSEQALDTEIAVAF